jgi:hypothetical protein
MTLPVDIRSVVVCDDVRREDNGKALLIGVYVGAILLPKFPAPMRLAFYFLGIGKEPRSGSLDFRIQHTLSNGESPAIVAKAEISEAEAAEVGRAHALVFAGVPFNFDQQTELVISVKENGDWREVERKQVISRS